MKKKKKKKNTVNKSLIDCALTETVNFQISPVLVVKNDNKIQISMSALRFTELKAK